ncbi:MAG: hypothetical protein INQ03_25555 [Candidatus Heimdallarchaeota archaeon]|nr:hypothetical protein [Candidatus Heimdallarchaeota archaeon]
MRIRSKDVIAVRSYDSGFNSIKFIGLGIFILILTIQSMIYFGFGTITITMLGISIYLIAVGLQREFKLIFDYFTSSNALPAAMGGSFGISGSGNMPVDPKVIAETTFGSFNYNKIAEIGLQDGFIGIGSYKKRLELFRDFLIIQAEKSTISPSSVIIIPTRNILAVQVYPKKMRSVKIGLYGILLTLLGVTSVLAELYSLLLLVLLGVIMIYYGFSKVLKIVITYAIVGNDVSSFTYDGAIMGASFNVDEIGEIIMGAAVNAQQMEVPAK